VRAVARYVITGATRGIGRAVVDALAGDELVLIARSPGPLAELAASLPAARAVPVDLAEPAGLGAAVAAAGVPDRLDGIVHAAGIATNGRVDGLDPAAWRRQLDVNVVAVAELTRAYLPALRAARATVVMVNSGAGLAVKRPGGAAYAASKFALRALADGLRLEEPDLRVTTVFPGPVATDMQVDLRAYMGVEYRAEDYLDPATVASVVVAALRLPPDAVMPEVTLTPAG
jgi:NADP-dependent 3-hydroxy acid dehydrogenase YdfG